MALKKKIKTELEPPDTFVFEAAQGWAELGNPQEALAELAELSEASLNEPKVLQLKWLLHAELKQWPESLVVAEQLVKVAPTDAFGWIHRAYSLRRVSGGGLDAAWHALRPSAERFPGEKIIPYNLACYAAQMNRLDEAWAWLQRAMDTEGDVRTIKTMALADEDLKPLWERIKAL